MKRSLVAYAFLALAVATACSQSAEAQLYSPIAGSGYQPYPRAPLNPYLNLIRGGDPASNYFLGTVRQRQQSIDNRQFSSALNYLDRTQQQLATNPAETGPLYVTPTTTGHPATFLNYGGYYPFGGTGVRAAQSTPYRLSPGRRR